MELLCEDCRAVIQVADERIPPNSTFRLTCPRCKSKIVVNASAPEGPKLCDVQTSTAVIVGNPPLSINAIPREDVDEKADSPHSNQMAALLYWPLERDCNLVKEALQRMGYVVDVQAAADQTIDRLRMNQYRIVVLSSHPKQQSGKPIEDYLCSLNMNIRREMFVVIMGEYLKTADYLQAFMNSVDLVIHLDDLLHMEFLITQGLRDHARFYKVFLESLVEAGKRL